MRRLELQHQVVQCVGVAIKQAMHYMLMLKASCTSAVQRGQAHWALYESTSTHLPEGGAAPAPAPEISRASRVFLIIPSVIFHIIGPGLLAQPHSPVCAWGHTVTFKTRCPPSVRCFEGLFELQRLC